MLIHFKKIFESKWVVWSLSVIGLIAFIIVIFFSGVIFGNHQGDYRCAFGNRYEKMFFNDQPDLMMRGFNPGMDTRAFGANGKVISIASSTLIVTDLSGVEKVISVDSQTQIKLKEKNLNLSEVLVGQNVAVFGQPTSDGLISARLIRIMPEGFKMPFAPVEKDINNSRASSTIK